MADNAFYEAYVEVIPTAKGFERSLNKQFDGAGASAQGGFVGGFGKGFGAKLVGIVGVAFAAINVGDFIADSITNGSDYSQAQGAVEQVYGKLGSDALVAFAEGGAAKVGQSMNDILGSASLLGVFGKAAGLADKDLVDFSETLITLGADLSSFANTTPAEAVEALSAGLRGESEPLRKYGVLLDDAALKARALEMGIYDGNGPLSQQQRILAAYNEILAQTTDQQGQFARESDTLAGKQAVMAASFENVSTKIGVAFLPIAEQLADVFVEEVIPALEDFTAWLEEPGTKEAISSFAGGIADLVVKLVNGANQIGDFTEDMIAKFENGARQIGDFFNGVGEFLQEFANRLENGQNQVFGFFGAIGEAFANGARQIVGFSNAITAKVNEVITWFQRLPGEIGKAVSGAGLWLANTGTQLIQGLVRGIQAGAGAVFSAISGVVTGAIDWAKELLGIASPSKVFMEIGAFTGQGFVAGIESQARKVQASVNAMIPGAPDADAAGGAPSFTFNGQYAMSAGELMRAAETERRRAYAVAGVF